MRCFETMNIILLFLKLIPAKGDIYSAVVDLETLIVTQGDAISQLDKVVNEKRCKVKVVKEYLNICKREQIKAVRNISMYIANPIDSFRLVKRLSVDFDYVEALLKDRMDFRKNLLLTYPTLGDLDGAAEALFRLQVTYNLNITEMANGSWNTKNNHGGKVYLEHTSPMSTSDCLELGKALFRLKYLKHGINWINEAINKFDEGIHDDGRYSRDELTDELNKGHESLDDFVRKFVTWYNDMKAFSNKIHDLKTEQLIDYYRQGLSVEETLRSMEKNLQETYQKTGAVKKRNGLEFLDISQAYYTLCRDELKLPSRLVRKLKCYYAFTPHPYLKIAPIKTEQIHKAPEVLLLHDVISDTEIRYVIDLAKGDLKRGQVSSGGTNKTVPDRVCKVSYLNNSLDIVKRLTDRISAFSGLDLRFSEKLQVANYGLGGYYSLHYDFWELSDVEQGGATVFNKLGLTVFPKKGAALFWPNLLSSGQGDYNTLHAACPVLKGSKWENLRLSAASSSPRTKMKCLLPCDFMPNASKDTENMQPVLTQWINLRGQELKKPCLSKPSL